MLKNLSKQKGRSPLPPQAITTKHEQSTIPMTARWKLACNYTDIFIAAMSQITALRKRTMTDLEKLSLILSILSYFWSNWIKRQNKNNRNPRFPMNNLSFSCLCCDPRGLQNAWLPPLEASRFVIPSRGASMVTFHWSASEFIKSCAGAKAEEPGHPVGGSLLPSPRGMKELFVLVQRDAV